MKGCLRATNSTPRMAMAHSSLLTMRPIMPPAVPCSRASAALAVSLPGIAVISVSDSLSAPASTGTVSASSQKKVSMPQFPGT